MLTLVTVVYLAQSITVGRLHRFVLTMTYKL